MWPVCSPKNDMFRGANKVTLDSKGRLAMPTRYRERIVERSNGRLIATVGPRGPLSPYLSVARVGRDRAEAAPPADAESRRAPVAASDDRSCHRSGARTPTGESCIPPSLREYAQLARTAMLIGQGNRFELWDEAQWNENREAWLKVDESAEELPPELDIAVVVESTDAAAHAGASRRSAGRARCSRRRSLSRCDLRSRRPHARRFWNERARRAGSSRSIVIRRRFAAGRERFARSGG